MLETPSSSSCLLSAQVSQDICRQVIPLHSQHYSALDIRCVRDSDFPKPAKAFGCLQHPNLYSKRPTRVPSAGSITFVDRPAWIYIKEPYTKSTPAPVRISENRERKLQRQCTKVIFLPKMTSCGLVPRFTGNPKLRPRTHKRSHMRRVKESAGAYRDQKTPKHIQATKKKKKRRWGCRIQLHFYYTSFSGRLRIRKTRLLSTHWHRGASVSCFAECF